MNQNSHDGQGTRGLPWGRLGQFTDLASDVIAPTLPAQREDGTFDCTPLADDEIGTLHTELEAYLAAASANVRSMDDVTALEPVTEAILALRTEADLRYNGPARAAEALAAMTSRLSVEPTEPVAATEPVVEPAPEPQRTQLAALPTPAAAPVVEPVVEPVADVVVEPVVAAAPALPALPGTGVVTATRSGVVTPMPIRPAMTITAAGEVPGVTSGDELPDLDAVARLMIRKREAIGRPGPNCGSDLLTVASAHAEYPDDRYLRETDTFDILRDKIQNIAGPEAIVASGGLCAPVQPYYEIQVIAEASRPVRDSLPSFMADRGGIRLVPPPKLSDASGAIGFITAAVDAAALGGSGGQITAATKPCLHVTCPGIVEYDIAAVTRCLEFGNFTARAYPEQVTAWMALAMAQHARKGETALIDIIAANSTQVTLAKVVGAARDLIAGIVKMAAYYRNNNRMGPDRPLRCMLPAWVLDLSVADLVKGSGYEAEFLSAARAQITDALAAVGVNVTFYLDSGTGKGQLFNSGSVQTAGAAVAFPTTVVWYLFAEGSFLFLDGGTLDFGVVRDSSLNSLNNYRIFAETFETAAFVGVESLECTQTVAANGTFAGPAYGSTTVASPVAIPTAY